MILRSLSTFFFFFFTDPATTEIYTLSLHDALPIFKRAVSSFMTTLNSIKRDQPPPPHKKKEMHWPSPALKPCARQRKSFLDRKSTRLSSSHVRISYAVFCLKKKNNQTKATSHQPAP